MQIISLLKVYKFCIYKIFCITAVCFFTTAVVHAQKNKICTEPVCFVNNDSLVFNKDSLGNRIPDFSYCGYKAGEKAIPNAPVKIVVPLTNGDATSSIQNAINYVSKLAADNNGIRGAVLLQQGTYSVKGSLHFNTSGVVLRGSGMLQGGTILLGAGDDRATLININGKDDKVMMDSSYITDKYVPVNSMQFNVASPAQFKKKRPCHHTCSFHAAMDQFTTYGKLWRWIISFRLETRRPFY